MFKNEAGFTLVEMLVVLVIISVLILLLAPQIHQKSDHVHETGCTALQNIVQAQVNLYYFDNNEYPNNLSELVTEGYIREEQTTCSNGVQLEIETDGTVIIND